MTSFSFETFMDISSVSNQQQLIDYISLGNRAKCLYFWGHRQILTKIIAAATPGEAKKLGRLVNNFNQKTWIEHRFAIVEKGNLGKFEQNQALREFLINTNQRILVEASPRDRIWGIGLEQNHPQAANPHQWRGLNLLGFALMAVRNILQGSGQLADY
ncbi:MAG: NADAR family protein [Waterburya sp.]